MVAKIWRLGKIFNNINDNLNYLIIYIEKVYIGYFWYMYHAWSIAHQEHIKYFKNKLNLISIGQIEHYVIRNLIAADYVSHNGSFTVVSEWLRITAMSVTRSLHLQRYREYLVTVAVSIQYTSIIFLNCWKSCSWYFLSPSWALLYRDTFRPVLFVKVLDCRYFKIPRWKYRSIIHLCSVNY